MEAIKTRQNISPSLRKAESCMIHMEIVYFRNQTVTEFVLLGFHDIAKPQLLFTIHSHLCLHHHSEYANHCGSG